MSQNNKICTKCDKTFKTDYNLNKHINRTISCDIILQCERCKKIFTTNVKLVAHTNRKIPCANSIYADKLVLLNAKEQSELNILDKKLVIKQKLAHEATLKEQLKIEAKQKLADNVALQLLEKQKITESKIEAAFKLQEMKNVNKRITAKILNDRADAENKRLALDKTAEAELEYEIMYNMAYKASKYTENFFNDGGMDSIFRELCRGVTQQHCVDIFTKAETCTDIVHKILKDVLNNDNPKNKNLFYNSRIAMFSAITVEIIDDVRHVIIIQKTYQQVFDMLLPIIEHCYSRYNGHEMALHEYKCDNILAKNEDILHKFARFAIERKNFSDLVMHNKHDNTQLVVYNPEPLPICVKALSHNLQTVIIDNTNIYTPRA